MSFDTTLDTLKSAFAQAGGVESAEIKYDKLKGYHKGFGFVEMVSEEDAKKAIEMWNGKELDGRKLTVNEARPMGERPPRREGGGYDRRGDFGNQGSNW